MGSCDGIAKDRGWRLPVGFGYGLRSGGVLCDQAGGVALDRGLKVVLHGNERVAFAVGAALAAVDATLLVTLELILQVEGGLVALRSVDFH